VLDYTCRLNERETLVHTLNTLLYNAWFIFHEWQCHLFGEKYLLHFQYLSLWYTMPQHQCIDSKGHPSIEVGGLRNRTYINWDLHCIVSLSLGNGLLCCIHYNTSYYLHSVSLDWFHSPIFLKFCLKTSSRVGGHFFMYSEVTITTAVSC
jgi:hypothetical protein